MELWNVFYLIDQHHDGRMLVIEKSPQWVRYLFESHEETKHYRIYAIEPWEEPKRKW